MNSGRKTSGSKGLARREGGAIVAVLALLLCGARTGLAQAAGDPALPATKVVSTDRFELHSDPWVNLHHFLYQWAREDEGLGTGRRHVPVPERSSLAELPAAEQRAWLQAVALYRRSVASLGHFDRRMLLQKHGLLELGGDPRAAPPDAIPGIAAALSVTMPVYRSRWWPGHDRANRAWIAEVAPFVLRHEARFVGTTRRIYGAEWPDVTRRVDVSAYANFRAGYTAQGHTVMYSTDAGSQQLYGVEVFFHEAQHLRDVGGKGRGELAAAFEAAGVEPRENLWHALIFATGGAFARSIAERERLAEHVPYWIREGFESFQGWSALVPAANEHWLPVVRGDASREDGFAALVRRFGDRAVADSLPGASSRVGQLEEKVRALEKESDELFARLQEQATSEEEWLSLPDITKRELLTAIQDMLRQREFDIEAHGAYVLQTKAAIKEFQRNHGMLVTGRPSVRLLEELQRTAGVVADFGMRPTV